MNHFIRHKLGIILIIMLIKPVLSRADVGVIVNSGVKESVMSFIDLKLVFTNKIRTWQDGKKINIVIFEKADVKEAFLKEFIQMTPSQFKTLWLELVFTGKANMYKIVYTEESLLDIVSNTPGAIGFIAFKGGEKINNGVKAIKLQ